MNSKLLKFSNISIIIFSIIFFQFSLFFVNKLLEKKEASISIKYVINSNLNLYIKNQEIISDIHNTSLKNLRRFISDQFNINILNVKQKNEKVIYWKSYKDDKLTDDFKIEIQTYIKKNLTEHIEKNIKIFKEHNIRLKEYYENSTSDLELNNLKKIVELEIFLDYVTNDKKFFFYDYLDFNSYKKKVSIIENLIITFVGSVLFLIFFINRKNILN